ncbi:MAG: RagB/SusD family nutrient uptake outer membrane protein [Cyclobacteriaceae bacterium]|nr:RagB/SusD family nutrient uptake outer membrane protein [Cyclobacteriaceae bacterium]
MKSLNMYKFLMALVFVSLAGCGDDFFNINPPGDKLSDANFFVGEADSQAALIAVYDAIQKQATYQGDDFNRIENYPLGDIIVSTGEPDDYEFSNLNWDRGFFRLGNSWRAFYAGIARANKVIDGVSGMTDDQLVESKRLTIIAQAKYLRAIMYFPLVRLFGDVPLVLAAPSLENDMFPARTPAVQVWEQIKLDLMDASTSLPKAWSGEDVGRATQGSALAMLAKVSLYTKEYDQTIKYAEELFALNEYGLLSSYRDVFSDFNEWNEEIVFATRYQETKVGGWGDENEGQLNLPLYLPTGVPTELTNQYGGWGGLGIRDNFWNSFERDTDDKIIDKRFSAMFLMQGETHPTLPFTYDTLVNFTTGNFPGAFIKYWYKPADVNQVYSGQDIPISRFAEVLLDYAEALNEEGRSDDALIYINKIRTRAGLPDFDSTDKDEILMQIMEERRKETFYEANLFSEINRRGLFLEWIKEKREDISKLNLNKPFLQTNPILMPIPLSELEINPNLTQNEGYDF